MQTLLDWKGQRDPFAIKCPMTNEWDYGDALGQGSFANVWSISWRTDLRKIDDPELLLCAAKVMCKSDLRKGGINLDVVHHEVAAMRKCGETPSQHVCRLLALYDTRDTFYLIIERCPGGHLGQLGKLSEAETCAATTQILAAVAHCHDCGVVHRDLKPANLCFARPVCVNDDGTRLIDVNHNVLKLVDFGSSAFCAKGESIRSMPKGTPDFLAPEQLLARPHGQPADIFSVGIVICKLLTGSIPKQSRVKIQRPGHHASKVITRVPVFANRDDGETSNGDCVSVSASGQVFITALLEADPSKRPTAEEALRLPWLHQRRVVVATSSSPGAGAGAACAAMPSASTATLRRKEEGEKSRTAIAAGERKEMKRATDEKRTQRSSQHQQRQQRLEVEDFLMPPPSTTRKMGGVDGSGLLVPEYTKRRQQGRIPQQRARPAHGRGASSRTSPGRGGGSGGRGDGNGRNGGGITSSNRSASFSPPSRLRARRKQMANNNGPHGATGTDAAAFSLPVI